MTDDWFANPSLGRTRDALSSGYRDPATEEAVTAILRKAEKGDTDATEALVDLQDELEVIRGTAMGVPRIAKMNSFVRTLGQKDSLATFLDVMRRAANEGRSASQEIAERVRSRPEHCIYGWADQSMVLVSQKHRTEATSAPEAGVDEYYTFPVAEWHISIHIWQPNPEAEGFSSTKRLEPGIIAEPPHSHPFPFVSYMSIGEMRQSIYEEIASPEDGQRTDRYGNVELQRTDGVWPPHQEYESSRLRTLEDRLLLAEGESYFMPTSLIHDVEFDRAVAENRPAITLFLCSETTNIARTYMVPTMAEYHRQHPDITKKAKALDPEVWDAKLLATAAYLRGDTDHLRMGELFECGSSYAFLNV